jgi:hypothetical protein
MSDDPNDYLPYDSGGTATAPEPKKAPEPIQPIMPEPEKPVSVFSSLPLYEGRLTTEHIDDEQNKQHTESESHEAQRHITEDVHFISTNKGVPIYYLKRPNGSFIAMKETTLKRHLKRYGMSDKPPKGQDESEIGNFMLDLQLYSALEYAGNIAGFDAGLHEINGTRFLSMRSPVTPAAKSGKFATLQAVLNSVFPDEENQRRFKAWLYYAWSYLESRQWAPLPVLALAGPPNSGKSLLVDLITYALGGTEPGQAIRYMTGETGFNADLAGSHVLVVDDEISSKDMRSRLATGARIKSLAVTNRHRIEPKGYDAVLLHPHWRAVFACNDEPESLQVLPPIDDGLKDKILLLHCEKGKMPMPSATPAQRADFMDQLKADIPGLLHDIMFSVWKDHYGDTRQKVTGWQDADLLEILQSLDPASQLLDLIDVMKPWELISGKWKGPASELESLLMDHDQRKTKQILYYPKACGSYLSRLAKSHPDRVSKGEVQRKYEWIITCP